jgi:SAM-dependent methyltransferase
MDFLPPLIKELGLESAVDVGCGLGFFSDVLSSFGLRVEGVDGREDNVTEAKRRYPSVEFRLCDAEELTAKMVGRFDLVFCYGLLYHLQNPFRVIKQLKEMTNRLLLVEAVIYPGSEAIMGLIDEPPGEDQGLSYFAFYPTQECLEKMFYRAGFNHVYRFARLPQHPGYFDAPGKRKVRTVLAASLQPLSHPAFTLVGEPKNPIRPWDPTSGLKGPIFLNRVLRFTQLPTKEKVVTLKRLLRLG